MAGRRRRSDGFTEATPADLLAAVRRGVESGEIEETKPDYEAAAKVFDEAGYRNKGIRVLLDRAVDAAFGGRLVIPVDGEET